MTDPARTTDMSIESDAELMALFERWKRFEHWKSAYAEDAEEQLFSERPEDAQVQKAIDHLEGVLNDLNDEMLELTRAMAEVPAHTVLGIALKCYVAWQINGGGTPKNELEELALAATRDALRLAGLDISALRQSLTGDLNTGRSA